MDAADIYVAVQRRYGSIAETGNVDTEYAERVAKSFGYSSAELLSVPKDANLGLVCGNPLAVANVKEGEHIIDLGSGAGLDVFLAANKIGPAGKAIGIDMNKAMIQRARINAQQSGITNVEFIESKITTIPLMSESADCIISNCVINLVPKEDKPTVFNEIFRLLRPGGRVAVSDTLTRRELPEHIRQDMSSLVGCIAGASQISEYEIWLKQSGFIDIAIVDMRADLNVYKSIEQPLSNASGDSANSNNDPQTTSSVVDQSTNPSSLASSVPSAKTSLGDSGQIGTQATNSCCVKPSRQQKAAVDLDEDLNQWAGSFKIYALKPLLSQSLGDVGLHIRA